MKISELSVAEGGELDEIIEMRGGVIRAIIITCLVNYILTAVPLKSCLKPLIVMAVVPFGFVWAIIGRGVMDLPFSILLFFSVLALNGVAVNDPLVMMTFYLHGRNEGRAMIEIEASAQID